MNKNHTGLVLLGSLLLFSGCKQKSFDDIFSSSSNESTPDLNSLKILHNTNENNETPEPPEEDPSNYTNTDGGVNCATCPPLDKMGKFDLYKGLPGGLYENGNNMPLDHFDRGIEISQKIEPLNALGNPSPSGKIVLLSVGYSNVSQEFCGGTPTDPNQCSIHSFQGKVQLDQQDINGTINNTNLVVVNGAISGQTTDNWDLETFPNSYSIKNNYETAKQRLALTNVTPAQVQVVWMKVTTKHPSLPIPDANSNAHLVLKHIGGTARTLKIKYPNLKMIIASSRIYGGYSDQFLSPEPYAYETGFSLKWAIQSQIDQLRGEEAHPIAGDLSLANAPLLMWGPYLWANADKEANSLGIIYPRSDISADGIHPSTGAIQKVSTAMMNFLKTSALTKNWFLRN